MSFFDELTQKAKNVASAAGGKAREAADSARISADIIKERRVLDKNYRAIGQWFVCEHSDDIPAAVADLVAAVRTSQAKIEELQSMRSKADAAAHSIVCPVCGETSNTKFCPHCGAPMSK